MLGPNISCILEDDNIEGSKDELLIAQKVLYDIVPAQTEHYGFARSESLGIKRKKVVQTASCSKTGQSTMRNEAAYENFSIYNADDLNGLCQKNSESSEGSTHIEKNDHPVPAKRIKLSVNELSNFKPFLDKSLATSIPLKDIISGTHQPASTSSSSIFMSHVVESTAHGVTSSCYLLKKGIQKGKEGNCVVEDAAKCGLSSSGAVEGKGMGFSGAITPLMSQESIASKDLVNPATDAPNEFGPPRCTNKKIKRGIPVELDDTNVLLRSDGSQDSRLLLRHHIFHLLADAGWSIEKRKRNCRSHAEFLFISPQEKPFRELKKAWIFFGMNLLAQESVQRQAEYDKQWSDFGHFFSDLSNTLMNIENERKDRQLKGALAHWWTQLDPFVNVVFVERKLKSLKSGIGVKASCSLAAADKKSVAKFGLKQSEGKTERHASKKLSDCSVGPESSFPILGSDITHLQPATCLYEVPISIEIGDVISEGKTISPPEYSGLSSPSCNRQNSDSGKDVAKDVAVVSFSEDVEPFNRRVHDRGEQLMISLNDCPNHVDVELLQSSEQNKFQHAESPKMSSEVVLSGMVQQSGVRTKELMKNDIYSAANANSKKKMDKRSKKISEIPGGVSFGSSASKSAVKNTSKGRSIACQLKDNDLLISAIIQKKSCSYGGKHSKPNARTIKSKPLKKHRLRKGRCRSQSLGMGGKPFADDRWPSLFERTMLSFLKYSGVISVNEIIQYRDLNNYEVVKDGVITTNGIVCKCCCEVFSLSSFKIHAGFDMKHPCLNLFMESSRPFILCQLQAWSAEYKAWKSSTKTALINEVDENDDSCGLCGEGGELLCCDNCPSTFHQSCLLAEELPDGSWYCSNCTCWSCGDLVKDEDVSTSNGTFKCAQCDHKYHAVCLRQNGLNEIGSNPWFCSRGCEQVYSGLHFRVGLTDFMSDGLSWTLLRCIHDDRVHSAQQFALKAECNAKLAVALTIMEECFLSMIDPRTGIDMIPHVLYNCGSTFARLNYQGFFTAVLEKNDVLVCVASIRVHGTALAEMPLVATCSKYRRQGLCKCLLNAIEKMLISIKVEKLVIAALPEVVTTWTIGFGFVPMEEDEKKSLNNVNLMVFPGTVMLKKALYIGQVSDPYEDGAGSADDFSSRLVELAEEGPPLDAERCIEPKCGDKGSCFNKEDAGDFQLQAICCEASEVVEDQKMKADVAQSTPINCLRLQENRITHTEGMCPVLENDISCSSMQLGANEETSGIGTCVQVKVGTALGCEASRSNALQIHSDTATGKADTGSEAELFNSPKTAEREAN